MENNDSEVERGTASTNRRQLLAGVATAATVPATVAADSTGDRDPRDAIPPERRGRAHAPVVFESDGPIDLDAPDGRVALAATAVGDRPVLTIATADGELATLRVEFEPAESIGAQMSGAYYDAKHADCSHPEHCTHR